MRAIPLARTARRRHGLEPIVGRAGTLDAADAAAARRIAARLTASRDADGGPAVSAGEVAALAAMDGQRSMLCAGTPPSANSTL